MKTQLQDMLASGRDSALLRFSLGELCYKDDELEAAISHLGESVRQSPRYSAAWKLYGRALADHGELERAAAALEQGITVAEDVGDNQAAREMQVFAKRVAKRLAAAGPT